jgi:hypothetical protein
VIMCCSFGSGTTAALNVPRSVIIRVCVASLGSDKFMSAKVEKKQESTDYIPAHATSITTLRSGLPGQPPGRSQLVARRPYYVKFAKLMALMS